NAQLAGEVEVICCARTVWINHAKQSPYWIEAVLRHLAEAVGRCNPSSFSVVSAALAVAVSINSSRESALIVVVHERLMPQLVDGNSRLTDIVVNGPS